MRGTGASLLDGCRLRHSWIKILGPRGGKVTFQVREDASPAGVLLHSAPEKIAHQNQGRGDRECRGWLPPNMSLPCLFSAVSLAQFEFRLGFPACCGVALWMHEVGVEPRTAAIFRLKLPKMPSDASELGAICPFYGWSGPTIFCHPYRQRKYGEILVCAY